VTIDCSRHAGSGDQSSRYADRGEDWWKNPTPDPLPQLTKSNIATPVIHRTGALFMLRLNPLYPPFDKPAMCRALMGAIDQKGVHDYGAGRRHLVVVGAAGFFSPRSRRWQAMPDPISSSGSTACSPAAR
jgi:hypothetical protein